LNIYRADGSVTVPITSSFTFSTAAIPLAPTDIIVEKVAANVKLSWKPVTDPASPAVSSYPVYFQNQAGTYVQLSNICQSPTCDTNNCTCSVPMNTLTSSLGWTIGATSEDINVQVFATNAVGTSVAGTQTTTIKKQFVP
jgi:hypothetical protein